MNKKLILGISVILYIAAAIVSYSYFSGNSASRIISPINSTISQSGEPDAGESTLKAKSDEPKTEECPLNGELLPKSFRSVWEKRRPLGVMIENHTDARPQSGLSQADVIYEAVAEGGITRFLAMFYCKDAPLVGPVRSARIYFMQMLGEYGDHPLYAHVGGANTPGPADALGTIRKLEWDSYNDMNQFAIPFPYYYRDYERNPGVATEHTMYSSTEKLFGYARDKRKLTNVDADGKLWDANFVKWQFKGDAARAETTTISFDFWPGKTDYSVRWVYDTTNNSYKRFHGQSPHIDKNNDQQIVAKNIVVLMMKESPANDGYPGGHRLYKTSGSGAAILFQDGTAVKGTWAKKDMFSRLKIYDGAGHEVKFNRGLIWMEIVPEGNKISY